MDGRPSVVVREIRAGIVPALSQARHGRPVAERAGIVLLTVYAVRVGGQCVDILNAVDAKREGAGVRADTRVCCARTQLDGV